jgi:subtilase family serine protease
MRQCRVRGLASVGAVIASLAVVASSSAATPARTQLPNSKSPVAAKSPKTGAVAGDHAMDFSIDLKLSDPAGAAAFAKAVSTPGTAQYRKFLTPAQWEATYSPTAAEVTQVKSFLTSNGFTVDNVSADRMAISVTGTAQQVETTFGTALNYHSVDGKSLVLADSNLSVPSSVAGVIAGVTGVNDVPATPSDVGGPSATTGASADSPVPPDGFRNAQPCGAYFGQKLDVTEPALPGGYPANPPYAPCGYTPSQIRGAYGLTGAADGTGTTVAIIDAYAAPTIFDDAHTYAARNDPGNPLKGGKFTQLVPGKFNKGAQCGGQNGWWGEETLDVEAVHSTAPGANILYAGAKNCLDKQLQKTLRTVVDSHLADVVSNSYGTDGGDLAESGNSRAAWDEILQMAAGTGVSVMFSSGDDGDDYDTVQAAVPSSPASSPWATAAGGTTLEVGASGQRSAEYGWSTASSTYCNQAEVTAKACTKKQLGTWGPLSYLYGSGGGTSYTYIQPFYQAGVVPTSLSEMNGPTPMRVLPDVSMDADPTTGLLVGETQTFPDGTYYDQYRIGGTSLASPLLAGVVARAVQTKGADIGFLNPVLYGLSSTAGALSDVRSVSSPQDIIRSDYVNSVDNTLGIKTSARTIDYSGAEQFCDPTTGACTSANTTLKTAPGYDNMTGLGSPGNGFVQALASGQ